MKISTYPFIVFFNLIFTSCFQDWPIEAFQGKKIYDELTHHPHHRWYKKNHRQCRWRVTVFFLCINIRLILFNVWNTLESSFLLYNSIHMSVVDKVIMCWSLFSEVSCGSRFWLWLPWRWWICLCPWRWHGCFSSFHALILWT